MRSLVFSGVAFACWVSAAPRDFHELASRAEEPCAQVSAMVAPMRAANPGVTPVIPGQIAFDCLQSVPLQKEQALGVTGSILPYVEFQSDLNFKAKPPADYEYPAVNLVEAVTGIVDKLQNNSYANEYAWQADVFKTFMSARDGHFRFAGDLISRPIRFSRNVSLVSVSMDGRTAPQLYVLDDIQKSQNNTVFKPSAITKINDQDAVTFVQTEADRGFQQDKDAAYNTIMFNPALDVTPGSISRGFFAGDGRYGFFYPGASTTLNFANGSTSVYETKARVPGNFTGVIDGTTAFQRFCTNPVVAQTATTAPAPAFQPGDAVNRTALVKGFPKPQVITSDLSASGYYLQSSANSDVGVLSFSSFEPNTPAEFQAVIQTMLAEMKRDGKTKLIVDLQGNGGGIIVNGFDAFRQLFPKTQDVLFAQQRAQPGYNALAQESSDRTANFNPATSDPNTLNLAENHFNFRFDINQQRQSFTSFPNKFGPFTSNGDSFTSLQQWNWSDPLLTSNETTGAGMDVTGYNSRQNFTQPFPASNIVMLYDGVCASTCTLFSEMMRVQGGVKSIALGGRPSSTQIQAIGGVKGAQSLSFDSLFSLGQFFIQSPATTSISANLQILAALSDIPMNRSVDNGINFSNHILTANLQDGTPAQFVRELADCRIFFTPAMVLNVTAMWEAAADVAWRGNSCVAGGISQGIVSAREEPPSDEVMLEFTRKAEDARGYLSEIQNKASERTVERMPGWDSLHGKGIPNMHIV